MKLPFTPDERHLILFSCRSHPESAKILDMSDQQLQDNIAKLLQRLRLEAQKSQYGNSDILLVAVSKTRPAADIRAAHACGLTDFGENYVQEALDKMAELGDLPLVGQLARSELEIETDRFLYVLIRVCLVDPAGKAIAAAETN